MDQLHTSTLLQPPSQWTTTPTPAPKLHELPSKTMDHAKTPNGDSNLSPAMQAVNATIDKLKAKLLPPIPHLLSVPTSDPYRGSRPWETHRGSPFDAHEYDELQYMTLVPGDNRGVARPRGGWEDEINSRSPYNVSRSRSGTATPQQGERGVAKPPRSRISLADYKSGKRAPRPSTESQPPAAESSRDKENVKVATKAEPAKAAQNGAVHSSGARQSGAVKIEDTPRPSDQRPSQSKPAAPSQVKENDRHALPPKVKEQQNTTPKPTTTKQEAAHPLPPKPAELNHAPKRPLEKPEQSQPEKRLKVEPKHTPSGAAKGHQRNTSDSLSRLFGTATKPKPSNPKQSQPTSVDNTPTKRAEDKKAPERGPASGSKVKDAPSATRVPEMPKLLSPLPEYLTSPTPVSFSSGQGEKPGKNGRNSPSTMKAESSVTKRKEQSEKTSPFRLPELLPRELPPNVEELLAKSKQPTRKHDTVQARHERSRNPDAPGVARKAPKLSAAEKRRASKASDSSPPEITYEPPRQIVKLKYKKSMSKDIQRILKMKPVPNRAVLELADGIVPGKAAVSKMKVAEGKRPRPVPDEQPERSIKRAKVPAKIDSDKAATAPLLPPFKSPGLAPTSAKKLASVSKVTPKKGDAMKSVAMRRVDSADDNTPTPKTGAASTPASTEKPKQNGSDPKIAEVERCRAANLKYSEMGKMLKRKRDVYIHSKENQLATLAGAESLLAYLVAFDAFDAQLRKIGRPNTGDNWLSLFPLLQANHDLGKAHLHLDIVILLIGGVATNALLALHHQRFSKEIPSNSADYLRFRDAMSENIRRNREFWEQYQMACKELAAREPEAVRDGGGMAFVRAPGGQALPVKTVKVEAAKMLREYVKRHKLEWEMQVDF